MIIVIVDEVSLGEVSCTNLRPTSLVFIAHHPGLGHSAASDLDLHCVPGLFSLMGDQDKRKLTKPG